MCLFSLILCILAAMLNIACFALDISDSWKPVVTITAWALLSGSVVLYAMLIFFFFTYVSTNVVDKTERQKKVLVAEIMNDDFTPKMSKRQRKRFEKMNSNKELDVVGGFVNPMHGHRLNQRQKAALSAHQTASYARR
eukprot:TRINITY_DN3970_c0_g4_i1.p1 TRINITY_DN3970_c0_g4~~TRINITY_DN3970_c0_g4_i1.p1  ORF type:complete len:138 (+),score=34.15 TRINITY_DN3970_c0_g4_i1:212-625(+)